MGIFSRLFNRDEDGAPAEESAGAEAEPGAPGDPSAAPEIEVSQIESVLPEAEPPTIPRGLQPPPPPRTRKQSTQRTKKIPSLPPLELPDLFEPPPSGEPARPPQAMEPLPPLPPPPPTADLEAELLQSWESSAPPTAAVEEEDDPFAQIASELDARFDASRTRSDIPVEDPRQSFPDAVTTADDLGAVRQLFSEMAVPFMSQVRDFMLELRHTDASTAWIDMCGPALASLRATCDQLDMPELARSLDDYVALLSEAKLDPSGHVHGEIRQRLLDCYQHMTELLPEAFEVGTGREPVIVQLLLLQVPGVHKLTIEKLYKAAAHQFDVFPHANPAELAEVAAIELDLAERIVEKFLDYRRRVHSVVTQFMPGEEHDNLSRLVALLREQERDFVRASASWSSHRVLPSTTTI